jgi:MFS family permease
VTGIQTAITLYTLVMACLMITGGKVGQIIGRKRAFAIGCVVYACGSLTTALAPNLTVLIIGWSFLESFGAVLIMPAIVVLVATNFDRSERPRAYGLVAAAGAIACALGPVIGGAFTTYLSWRLVFAGEVLIVLVIPRSDEADERCPGGEGRPARPGRDGAVGARARPDRARHPEVGLVGVRAAETGRSRVARALAGDLDDPRRRCGARPVPRLGEPADRARCRRATRPGDAAQPAATQRGHLVPVPVPRPAGIFFVVPLFLSVALGLSAVATGVRLLPLSLMLLLFAVGVPKLRPNANPQRVIRIGFVALFVGLVLLVALLDYGAGADIVTWPLLLCGAGTGAIASQLGSVTVSAVPDEQSGEVGGLQNTGTQLGASIGTALTGAILISALTASFLTGIANNPRVPDRVVSQAQTELASGIPFMSDDDLEAALADANVPRRTIDEIVQQNEESRIDGLQVAVSILALFALVALLFTRAISAVQPGAQSKPSSAPA